MLLFWLICVQKRMQHEIWMHVAKWSIIFRKHVCIWFVCQGVSASCNNTSFVIFDSRLIWFITRHKFASCIITHVGVGQDISTNKLTNISLPPNYCVQHSVIFLKCVYKYLGKKKKKSAKMFCEVCVLLIQK